MKRWVWSLFILALLSALPLVVRTQFYLHIFILTFLYASFANSWNLIGGYAGQLSLGHAAFFGIGAYACAIGSVKFGISPFIGLAIGVTIAVLVSGAIGYPCFRLRGPFYTLSTIAFAEVVRLLTLYWRGLTEGAVGILIPFRPGVANLIFSGKVPYYYIGLVMMALSTLLCYHVERSRFGYYLVAVREDEDAAEACGIRSARYKLYAAMISAAIAAICGVFYVQYMLFIDPEGVFNLNVSIQAALMAIIGGAGTWLGPVVGAALLIPLGEFLRGWLGGAARGLHMAFYGIVLIVVVMVIPQGIVVTVRNLLKVKAARNVEEERR
jgi:branched-chain amino acid transport system permease protein